MTTISPEMRALAEVLDHQLGRGGCLPGMSLERLEEILLILLRADLRIRAHQRGWESRLSAEDLEKVHAAGGFTLEEWRAQDDDGKSRLIRQGWRPPR
jgi:hypothetical protein